MAEMDLRRLDKDELLEILQDQETEIDQLRTQMQAYEQQAQYVTPPAPSLPYGSIAEAAMELSGIFATAQAAADTYLEGVKASQTEAQTRLQQEIDLLQQHCEELASKETILLDRVTQLKQRESILYQRADQLQSHESTLRQRCEKLQQYEAGLRQNCEAAQDEEAAARLRCSQIKEQADQMQKQYEQMKAQAANLQQMWQDFETTTTL